MPDDHDNQSMIPHPALTPPNLTIKPPSPPPVDDPPPQPQCVVPDDGCHLDDQPVNEDKGPV